jgi:regulator of ribonuclease activity A
MEQRRFTTADLCDEFGSVVRVAEPLFKDYGGVRSFCGQIATVEVFDDNVLWCVKPWRAMEGEGC